jgi:hypothetical protein
MELKYVDCPSNKFSFDDEQYGLFFGFLWDENTLIYNFRKKLSVFDISNPLDIKKINSIETPKYYLNTMRAGNLIYLYTYKKSIEKIEYCIADLSDLKNITIAPPRLIAPGNTDLKDISSMTLTPQGKLLAMASYEDQASDKDRIELVYIEDNGELTLIEELNSFSGEMVLIGNLLIFVGYEGVFLYSYNEGKPVLLKHIRGEENHTPPPINMVLDNKYIVLVDDYESIQMIDIREPKKAKRLPKLKLPKYRTINPNFVVEGDTMFTVAMKNDKGKLLTIRLLSEGPVLYDETPIDMQAWPKKQETDDDYPIALFKKGKYFIIVSAYRDIGVFELIE